MLSKTISTSIKVNSMPIEARLLFTWIIPHCDDEGRMQAEPLHIKASVVPMTDMTEETILSYLKLMRKQKLIYFFGHKPHRVLEICDFEKFQSGHGYHKKASSLPSPNHLKGCSDAPDLVSNLTLLNSTELKPIVVVVEKLIKTSPVYNQIQAQDFVDLIKEFPSLNHKEVLNDLVA